ncbi:MAG: hypothetical protein HPY44_00905 [Armatimonadetes bacterium]|nr:hypothetical protein [Armatimonadota bacterium]
MITNPCLPAVALLELLLLGGIISVGFLLARMRVNGPCRFCLVLLTAWRVSVVVTMGYERPCWDYLWGVFFGYAFLYAAYHLAVLIRLAREKAGRSAGC